MGYHKVVSESVVCDGIENSPALIADLGVKGVLIPQAKALFDVHGTDADAVSCLCLQFYLVLNRRGNTSNYLSAELHHASLILLSYL